VQLGYLDLFINNYGRDCGFILGVQVHHNSIDSKVIKNVKACESVCRVRSLLPFHTATSTDTELLRPPALDMGFATTLSLVFSFRTSRLAGAHTVV